MREIPLTKGYVAIVDDEDYERLAAFRWRAVVRAQEKRKQAVYAARKEHGRDVFMHREVCRTDAPHVDHKDGDSLNNRRLNLRPATPTQNACNSRPSVRKRSSRFKGVYRERRSSANPWYAQILINGKNVHLGAFGTEEAAARAYDAAASRVQGEYAYLNFPPVAVGLSDPLPETELSSHGSAS